MLKKVLLSILFLTAISDQSQAKGRFKLSDGQKKVLKIGGGAALTGLGLFSVFAGWFAQKKHYLARHCLPFHNTTVLFSCKDGCQPGNSACSHLKYGFDKNHFFYSKSYDPQKEPLREHDCFLQYQTKDFTTPIEPRVLKQVQKGKPVDVKNLDAMTCPNFAKRFFDAFTSPRLIARQCKAEYWRKKTK